MTTRPIADCEACLDALTELVCDDFDAETRAAVLLHTKTCESCAKQLAQFRGVMSVAEALPLEQPSPRVRQAVLNAAREAQARKAVEAQVAREPRDSGWVRFTAWLERLGTWAMSPQVAMASVLLLMLGVGLLAFPMGREGEQAALRPADEAARPAPAASAAAAPVAAPEPEPTVEALPAPAALSESDEASERKGGGEAQLEGATAMPAADSSLARRGYADGARRTRPSSPSKDVTYRAIEPDLGGLSAASGGGKAASAGQAFPGANVNAREQEARARDDFAPPPAPAPSGAVASESVAAEDKKAESNPEEELLAQGIRAAQSGDAKGAIAVLRPLAEKAGPSVRQSASLWLARSYKTMGDCTSALRYYAPLTMSKAASGVVLGEAADCYERVGDLKQAALLRSRAEPAQTGRAKASAKPASSQPAGAATPAKPTAKE